MTTQQQPSADPHAADEPSTFFPWLGAQGREYIDVQRLVSCLMRRLAHWPTAVLIGAEEDTEGVYLDFARGPEVVIDLERED